MFCKDFLYIIHSNLRSKLNIYIHMHINIHIYMPHIFINILLFLLFVHMYETIQNSIKSFKFKFCRAVTGLVTQIYKLLISYLKQEDQGQSRRIKGQFRLHSQTLSQKNIQITIFRHSIFNTLLMIPKWPSHVKPEVVFLLLLVF